MTVDSQLIDDGIVVITIDNPPVNAGSHAVRSGLLEQLRNARSVTKLRAVVIIGAGSNFYSGSDIKEFDGPLSEPQLPEVIAAIESLPVPVVAAIRGLALGGGFELALGCDIRVGDGTAVVGLPEVNLGIIPGAGGTVRLPRLVGAARALEMIGTAARIDAPRAVELGILDGITDGDVMARALEAARTGTKRILREEPVPAADEDELEAIVQVVTRKGRHRPHIVAAADAIRQAVTLPAGEALACERETFTALRESEEAASARYLFFAERAAAKSLGSAMAPRSIEAVTVVGAGTMGASIAAALVVAGYRTTVVDTNADALLRAAAMVEKAAKRAACPASVDGFATRTDLSDGVRDADLVIDAVFEDLDVKRVLFESLDKLAPHGAILSSNTSYLDLDEIGAVVADPSRVVGLHFFNPAHLNRLIEVVETAKTAPEVMSTVSRVVRRLGKVGIRARVGEGFVANRVYAAYRAQCEILLEDGCLPEQIDRALVEFGFAMGPFAVGDMSGLDIAWARRRRLAETRDPAQRYVRIPDVLCEAGRFGQKSGAGWYRYENGSRAGVPDSLVQAVIEEERTRKGVTPREFDAGTIVRRIIAAMVIEAAAVVEDGIAQRASDIDLAMVTGFGFPRWHGGPLRYASRQSPQWLEDGVREVNRSCPVTFASTVTTAAHNADQEVRRLLAER